MTIERKLDIQYAVTDDIELKLDLYLPHGDGPHPTVIYVHGGAWKEGDMSADADSRLAAFAEYGLAVASINYRLIDQAVFPAGLHDVKAAIRWVRARGETFGLATGRIGLWGASSGAHLASLAALTQRLPQFEGAIGQDLDASSEVHAVVHWFGPVDLVNGAHRSWLEKVLLAPPLEPPLFGALNISDVAGEARQASPLHRVTPDAPPFLIAHGDRDRVLPVSESLAFHDALSRVGVESSLLVLGGAGHEDHRFDSPAVLSQTAAFLRTHLRGAA